MDSANFFSAKSLFPSALSASAIAVSEYGAKRYNETRDRYALAAGSGGGVNKCSATGASSRFYRMEL